MCRHLAYVGPPRRLAELLIEPPHALFRQAWQPRRQTSGVVNADGFGVGWYGEGDPVPARHRGIGPLWSDETFLDLGRVITSTAVLAAIRSATPGQALGQAAAAPFRDGRRLFSHNGALTGWPGAAVPLARLADPQLLLESGALTDSTLLWALVRGRLREGAAPEAAIREVVALARQHSGGALNLLLCDGAGVVATACGASLVWRRRSGGVIVASEPDDDDPGWHDVPDDSLVTVSATGGVDVRPL